ncbi:outer membrane beta-barrel protein [Caenimonas soli]|uniref:outer membrane beta-barrel protein n=1 Tax=Caenimonas soli TaxID=2735555 RepID=UPI00155743C5|nr:outer membrane beta-barrel protein [Caenimonas soli]NPC54672.1 outer membrane beta-barrel protein [Caenimonas soli]
MVVLRTLLWLLFIASALAAPVAAQVAVGPDGTAVGPAPRGAWLPGGRSYLGLNLGRSRYNISCGTTALLCDDSERSVQLYTGTMIGNFWGVELGYLNMGRIARAGGETRSQGLNLSLVGKTQLTPSLRLFGKVGTTYGRSETSALAASSIVTGSEQGFGLSYGAGVSFDFTPRLSATLEWDSNDFRFPGGARDPVRSTSLGLQFRY